MNILRTRLAIALGSIAVTLSAAPMASAFPIHPPPPPPRPLFHAADLLQPNKGLYDYWDAFDFDNNTFPQVAGTISAANSALSQIPYINTSINPAVGAHVNANGAIFPSGGGNGMVGMEARAEFDASLSANALGNSFNFGSAPNIDAYASYTRNASGGKYTATVIGHDFTGGIHHYVDASTADPLSISQSFWYLPTFSLPNPSINVGIGNLTLSNYVFGSLQGQISGSLNVVGGGSISASAHGYAMYEGTLALSSSSAVGGLIQFMMFNGPVSGGSGDATASATAYLSGEQGLLGNSLCVRANATLDAEQVAGYTVAAWGAPLGGISKSDPGTVVHPADFSAEDCVPF
jgi:hypothetical protein